MKKIILTTLFITTITLQSFACSGVYIATKNIKLFGFNEDFYNYNTIFMTMPAANGMYGMIAFGHSNSAQAIVNDKGLCYDGYGAPLKEVTIDKNKQTNNGNFIPMAMSTCETVEEVKALYDKFNHPWLNNGQSFFTDRYGNSAIFEGDTVIFKTKDYQVCTNFYQSDPESGISIGFYPCRRYQLLNEELQKTTNYSVEFVKELLQKVHIENQDSPHGTISTVYSLIIDQNNRKIYVYNFHNYEDVVILDIDEVLSKAAQRMPLKNLFENGDKTKNQSL